jgi:hypothetical protein
MICAAERSEVYRTSKLCCQNLSKLSSLWYNQFLIGQSSFTQNLVFYTTVFFVNLAFVFFTESWLLLTYGSGDADQKDETCKSARRVQILITCKEENEDVNTIS